MSLALAATSSHADPKRDVPDYDGRGNPDSDGDYWPLWIPRVVLAPVYLTHEYLIRRPLGALVRHAERDRWLDSLANLFEFHDGKGLIVPTALFDFGLLPSVGAYLAYDDFLADDNSLRLHAATWGPKWIDATAIDRYTYDRGAASLQGRFEFKRSEDNLFFGIGPEASSATQSRFGLERVEGSLGYWRRLHGPSSFKLTGGLHRVSFVDGTCCADPSIDTRVAAGELMTPPGYGEAYTTAFERTEIVLDTRAPRPAPGDGVYLRVHGDPAFATDGRTWIGYGANAGVAYDVTGHQRILKLQTAVDFVDPLHAGELPFTELSVMSDDLMAGFLGGWMIGRSTVAAQVAYTWPLWVYLDGQARFAVGNAFDAHLDGFSPGKLRMSGDFGLSTNSSRDQAFEALVGVGTEPFDNGAGIASIRVLVGSRRGF